MIIYFVRYFTLLSKGLMTNDYFCLNLKSTVLSMHKKYYHSILTFLVYCSQRCYKFFQRKSEHFNR